MIETAITYRARPKCTRCGWVGDWRSSTRSEAAATAAAERFLQAHVDFWHAND